MRDETTTRATPVIALQLNAQALAGVRAAHPQLTVIDASDRPAWEAAHEADVLFASPRTGWAGAPTERPPGWPGRLRWVHTASVGIDFYPPWLLDVPSVSCARGVAAIPIAEYALAALLDHEKDLAGKAVRDAGAWQPASLGLLHGKTLGLAGYGAIGREIALRARAFGMRVLAWRRSDQPITDDGVTAVNGLAALLRQSDHLVLALPLTPQTERLLDSAAFAEARPGLHLVNIARGRLIDQAALLQAFDTGRLAAATLDVTEPEPLPDGHPLYRHPQVRITPHLSWAAGDVVARSTEKFLDNLGRHLRGEPLVDIVDARRGY